MKIVQHIIEKLLTIEELKMSRRDKIWRAGDCIPCSENDFVPIFFPPECRQRRDKAGRYPEIHRMTQSHPMNKMIKMNMYITNLGFLIAITLAATASHATVITVKQDGTGDFTTIQEGIDATEIHDTVLVWPGTYYENINYNGHSITVASLYLTIPEEWYITHTVIDGNQAGSCVTVESGEDENTTICGFTIRNGGAPVLTTFGGGICVENSNLNILFCKILNNTSFAGGAIAIWKSEIFLSGSTIANNYSLDAGGGILILSESIIILDSLNLNSIYMNFGEVGSDIFKSYTSPPHHFVLDTFTVIQPDNHFIYSSSNIGHPVYDITWEIGHGKVEQVNADLYVNPVTGNDANGGLSPQDPLFTFTFAIKKMLPDTISPKTIHLAAGLYSPSANGERLPINQRSYVSLEGESMSNTIIDAEGKSRLITSRYFVKNYSYRNLDMRNGFDNFYFPFRMGGVYIEDFNDSIIVKDVTIENCEGQTTSAYYLDHSNLIANNFYIVNNIGGVSLRCANSGSENHSWYFENLVVKNNYPDSDPENGFGGGISFGGTQFSEFCKAAIINAEITGNVDKSDPAWGNRGCAGIGLGYNLKANLVNVTLGYNVVDTLPYGAQIGMGHGAYVNLYNCILRSDNTNEIQLAGTGDPSVLNVCYTNVKGGEGNIYNPGNYGTINWLEGNLDTDPLWEETGDYPYALKASSPCINTGTPMYEPGIQPPYIIQQDTVYKLITIDYDTIPLPSTDLAGNPRIAYGRIDMGAYEFADTTTEMTNNKYQIANNKVNVFPNPFTSNAFISFQTNKKGKVRTAVYNLSGQLVKKLTETEAVPGSYSITWDGTDSFGFEVNPGTYIVSVEVNGQIAGSAKVVKKRRK